jgi:hypothetical protein
MLGECNELSKAKEAGVRELCTEIAKVMARK